MADKLCGMIVFRDLHWENRKSFASEVYHGMAHQDLDVMLVPLELVEQREFASDC